MAEESEVVIRAALGINDDGTCCRHPNQMIYEGDDPNHKGSPRQRKLRDIVKTCRICDSESLAGGVRQRKSFAVIIGQVQTLHANKEEWNDFKKNWGPIGEENGEEKLDTSPRTPSMIGRVLSTAAGGSNGVGGDNPVNVDELTRQLTLRLAQVQDWILKEKQKELEAAASKVNIANDVGSSSQVSELQKQIKSMQLVIDGQHEQIAKLQKKAEKQQKTITQELKMIKMIALKRANQNNTPASPIPEIDALRITEESPGSNAYDRRMSTGAITHEQDHSDGRRRTVGATEVSTTALELLPQEAPPRQPERKHSGRNTIGVTQPRISSLPVQTIDQGGVDIDGTSASREGAPQMPMRQSSKAASPKVSLNPPGDQPNKVITRKVSLNNRENSAKPTMPRRVDLPEITVSAGIGDDTDDANDGISAITSSVISADITPSYTQSSLPSHVSPSITGSNHNDRQPKDQLFRRRSGDLASLDEAPDAEEADGEPDVLTPQRQRSLSLQEISFVPAEADDSVPPPPPPPDFELHPDSTPSSRRGSDPIKSSPSNEISFDASREFRISSPDLRRQSKVQDITFDKSQPLLFEASKALAVSHHTPMSRAHKKNEANSYAKRGSQSMSDLNFNVSEFEFDSEDPLMMAAKEALSTPLALQRKSLRKMHSATNRGKASRREIEFGLETVLSQTSSELKAKASVAQEFAANPDSIFNTQPQRKKPSPVEYSPGKTGDAPQEFAIGQEETGHEAEDEDDDDNIDEEDEDFSPPPDLPINDEGFIECLQNRSLSAVSDLSEGSYLLDQQLQEEAELAEIAEEENKPQKGLGAGATKQLPLEADLEFSDEDDDDTVESHKRGIANHKDDDDDSDNTGDIPARHQSILKAPRPLSATPSILRAAANKGAAAGGDDMVARTFSKLTYHVQEENVQDKYGDGGEYTGSVSVQDNVPHGHGLMKYDNDRMYEGDWSDGRWHGFGRWVNPNGDCYEGSFVYDARHGSGTYTWKNGNVYRGEFFEDKRQGKGTFNFANGNIYEGDFVNGVFEGLGRYEFDGGYYEGQWKSGRYHGHGFLLFADGSSYQGDFLDGVAHGQGEETCIGGNVRKGLWENGKPVNCVS